MGNTNSPMVDHILFNRVLEAMHELEVATDPGEMDRAAKKVATAATRLRFAVKGAVVRNHNGG